MGYLDQTLYNWVNLSLQIHKQTKGGKYIFIKSNVSFWIFVVADFKC